MAKGDSKLGGKMGGGFSHARDRGKGTLGKRLLNAELNFGTSKGNSIDSVLGRFQKNMAVQIKNMA